VNTYQKLVEKFGHEDRKKKCIEELSELIRAIARDDRANVLEETCQVLLQLEMLSEVYDFKEHEIEKQQDKEFKKLEELL